MTYKDFFLGFFGGGEERERRDGETRGRFPSSLNVGGASMGCASWKDNVNTAGPCL